MYKVPFDLKKFYSVNRKLPGLKQRGRPPFGGPGRGIGDDGDAPSPRGRANHTTIVDALRRGCLGNVVVGALRFLCPGEPAKTCRTEPEGTSTKMWEPAPNNEVTMSYERVDRQGHLH